MDKQQSDHQPIKSTSVANQQHEKTNILVTIQPPIFQLQAHHQQAHPESESINEGFQLEEKLYSAASGDNPSDSSNKNNLPFQLQATPNNSGLPDQLKSGIENLSGFSMNDVNVHYNSSKPAQLNAHAYAQGTDIHLGSGQEKHLPHEAWHVVQQKQGRVQPTTQMKGQFQVNDDQGLEKEADQKGSEAMSYTFKPSVQMKSAHGAGCGCSSCNFNYIQRKVKSGVTEYQSNYSTLSIQRVVHEPKEINAVRENLPGISSTENMISGIAQNVKSLQNIDKVVNIANDKGSFVAEYAKTISMRNHNGDTTKYKDYLKEAEADIDRNVCRAFTTEEGQAWFFGKANLSDVVHEVIHILSAQGGLTKLKTDLSNKINEGVTQFFTIKVCNKNGIEVTPAYPEELPFAENLATKFGIDTLYKIYFDGDLNYLYDKIYACWEIYGKSGKMGDGSNGGFANKNGWDDAAKKEERKEEIVKKLMAFYDNKVWLAQKIGPPFQK